MNAPTVKGGQPDWDFRFLDKSTDEKGQVGVAWTNADGSIRIKLNTRVVLEGGPSCILTLFPKRSGDTIRTDKQPLGHPALTKKDIDKLDF